MKMRSRSLRALMILAATAQAPVLLLGGCSAAPAKSAPVVAARGTAALVLASATDPTTADAVGELLESPMLAGRLDGMMGSPPPILVEADVTTIQVLDQQFTWNGRVYDSYTNTRWTTRQQRR